MLQQDVDTSKRNERSTLRGMLPRTLRKQSAPWLTDAAHGCIELMPSSPVRVEREKPLRDRIKFVQCPNPWCTERLPASQISEHEQVCRHMHETERARLESSRRATRLKLKKGKCFKKKVGGDNYKGKCLLTCGAPCYIETGR